MASTLALVLESALKGMLNGPQDMKSAVGFYARQSGARIVDLEQAVVRCLSKDPNDAVRRLLGLHLRQWDWDHNPAWAAGTLPNTSERRHRSYDLLRLSRRLQRLLDVKLPPFTGSGNIVITGTQANAEWYHDECQSGRDFYWRHLTAHLIDHRHFDDDAIGALNAGSDIVMERLEDPAAPAARAKRGLVVGYVQSGKTTNFTAVIAKAIDAGYRLIVVLSGTTNLLRDQTQRRLDTDLIGVENILGGADESEVSHDYKGDEDWPSGFVSYGSQPSKRGSVDITRLTGVEDFQSASAGLNPLEFYFEKREKALPLYARENLDHTGARIVVVKKQKDRLKRLVADLRAVGRERCAEIPALIIDDESDQASVNTINPRKVTIDKTRSEINKQIVEILARLPRAQYMGYTATPFAHVFVDPSNPTDIYPRDVILSLPRPDGYMGVREFHDFAPVAPGRMSNELAYVRKVAAKQDKADEALRQALDLFVVTGAIKKYRESKGGGRFKHHTMLVHQSARRSHHEDMVSHVLGMWRRAAYDSPGTSEVRLREAFEDCRRVWKDRGENRGLAFPRSYATLKPYIGQALGEIRRGKPVMMVNSAEGAEVPRFDAKEGVWKIIVGGAKLSRGYTIEGLTVSYFRRSTRVQDTLMQMGRWFGFRRGYEDLVRIFLGREERISKSATLDLFEAFEAMCRDEEAFRAQLDIYSKGSGITPADVPALVFNSHPKLRPTAANRMYNARLRWAAFDYREPTTQAVTGKKRAVNAVLFKQVLAKATLRRERVVACDDGSAFDSVWAEIGHGAMVKLLKNLEWGEGGCTIEAEMEYLRRRVAPVDRWLVIAPQVGAKAKGGDWDIGRNTLQVIARTRLATRFGVFSSPEHVSFAKWIVSDSREKAYRTKMRRAAKTGVLLFYPTRELPESGKVARSSVPVMGFALVLPRDRGQAFSVDPVPKR